MQFLRALLFISVVVVFGCSGFNDLGTAALSNPPSVQGSSIERQNPLEISGPAGHTVESCADPTVIRAHDPADPNWYMYCTGDPLYQGSVYHWMPFSRSSDLVHWTYVGDVFSSRPAWVSDGGGTWAPEIKWFNGQYYLYYTASQTNVPPGGSAIFVATSSSPVGPWAASPEPVIEPQGAGRWTYDPEVIEADGHRYIIYGSFRGGIALRELTSDGFHSLTSSEIPLTTSDRYEGAFVMQHDGFYYLMMSASDCCRGP